jgi:hypothetical protein
LKVFLSGWRQRGPALNRIDGPPIDQDYLNQMLAWSVEHNKKIKTIIFLQDINNNTSNIGSLNQFLGLYVPFRAPEVVEVASCSTRA